MGQQLTLIGDEGQFLTYATNNGQNGRIIRTRLTRRDITIAKLQQIRDQETIDGIVQLVKTKKGE